MPSPYANKEQSVRFSPPELITRQMAEWRGLRAEVFAATKLAPFDYQLKSSQHLLIASERSERDEGETSVEGLPKSTLHSLSGKLTFVPAGHELSGWQMPRVLTRVTYFYLDPTGPLLDPDLHFADIEFRPRLFFLDGELWRLVAKLRDEAKDGGHLTHYGEALGVVLAHELVRLNGGSGQQVVARGGLSGWQQKRVAEFVEANLVDNLRLSTLAGLVELSPYHFARAFKQSFGQSPHRFHVGRRLERAKALLADPAQSITQIAQTVGFAETSSFSAAFRKSTGLSPREYRRSLQ
jgi:AraC family transcriptional regulator